MRVDRDLIFQCDGLCFEVVHRFDNEWIVIV
jgi:hypothetical protein